MSFKVKDCETKVVNDPLATWVDFAIPIPLCIILHIILFIHGNINVRHLKKHNVVWTIPFLFTVLQLLAIIMDINEFFRLVIGSRWYIYWFNNPIYCYISSVLSRILTPIFYMVLLNILIIRLKISFEDSMFALSNCLYRIMMTGTYFFGIMFMIVVLTGNPPCIREYYANDIKQTLFFCRVNIEGSRAMFIYFGFLSIVTYNVVLGYLFVNKLRKVINHSNAVHHSSRQNLKIQHVMIKNTVLMIFTSLSTLLAYLMYTNVNGTTFLLYFDYLFNCIMIALMYNYNDKHYQCCCKLCIKCLLCCYGAKINETELFQIQSTTKTVPEITADKSQIGSSTNKTSSRDNHYDDTQTNVKDNNVSDIIVASPTIQFTDIQTPISDSDEREINLNKTQIVYQSDNEQQDTDIDAEQEEVP